MYPHIAKQLREALESGVYKKKKHCLGSDYDKKRFCCMGVLQQIAPDYLQKNPNSSGFPSKEVMDWAGFGEEGCLPDARDLYPNDLQEYYEDMKENADEAGVLGTLNDRYPRWKKVIEYLKRNEKLLATK